MAFSLLRRSLKPAFEFRAPEGFVIWKLLVSEHGVLAIDVRDPEKKIMQLAALDIPSGKTLWSGKTVGNEAWWLGLEKVEDTVLLLHHFAKPDMPEPLGITALGVHSGNILWHKREWKYLQSDAASVLASREERDMRYFFEVDLGTGNVIRELGTDESAVFERMPSNPFLRCTFAEEFSENHPSYDQFARRIADNLPLEGIRGAVDVAQRGKYFIVSYHCNAAGEEARAKGWVDNIITVFDGGAASAVFTETLVKAAPAVVPESFFIFDDTLLFVKDRSRVVGVKLQTH